MCVWSMMLQDRGGSGVKTFDFQNDVIYVWHLYIAVCPSGGFKLDLTRNAAFSLKLDLPVEFYGYVAKHSYSFQKIMLDDGQHFNKSFN